MLFRRAASWKTRRGWLQGYNGQAMAGCGSQVIVAHGVTQAENAGLEDKTTELFIATKKNWKQRQAQREQEAPRGRIPSTATLRERMERMERKLLTQRGRTAYKKRGATIEPVFGQMAMRGLNRFWLRGIGKVKGEWSLWQRHARPGAGDGARAISRSAPMAWLREVDTPP
ncbi:MAG: transposase [SAR324 cluster bacterium]|nr:transposase [SAR324 cluster bacterium]